MRTLAYLAFGLLLAGCMVGPDYKRPPVETPGVYRGDSRSSIASAESLGNEKWWEVFQDPVLHQLIRTAFEQNYDVRIAASRVLQAQAQLGITRANQFPTVSAGAQVFSEGNPKISSSFPSYQAKAGEVDLAVVWNLDFWGKYRRQTDDLSAELNLAQAQLNERLALVQIYNALGGGWQ